MTLIGILLIVTSLAYTAWGINGHKNNWVPKISLCSVAVFAGLGFVISHRISELTVLGVGTIKAATEQALTDAKTVADLKARVENQSATVDLVAKEASKAMEIAEQVADKNRQAEEKLKILDETITKANATLTNLNAMTEFTMTVVAALNDDRNAFDTLKKWSEDKNNPFSSKAEQATWVILGSHCKSPRPIGYQVSWVEGIDPSKFSLPELAKIYHEAHAMTKPGLLEYIINRNDIPTTDRLDFMIDVMKHDQSLTAVAHAGLLFTTKTKLKINNYLAIEYFVDWWGKHKPEFQEK